MALIQCNKCGNQVSDLADNCPHCKAEIVVENFKMVYIPFGDIFQNRETKTIAANVNYTNPCDIDETQQAKEIISKLIEKGWEIVSTSSVNGSKTTKNNIAAFLGSNNANEKYHTETLTVGIEVFLVKKSK